MLIEDRETNAAALIDEGDLKALSSLGSTSKRCGCSCLKMVTGRLQVCVPIEPLSVKETASLRDGAYIAISGNDHLEHSSALANQR